jgi:hypothetical protein
MKSFKAIVNESAKPTNPQDRAVVDAHTVEVTPHPTAGDEVFKGLKKEKAKRRNDKNVAAQAAISESDELTEDPTQEKPMMMNALRSMSHALQGVAKYVQSTQDPEEWFQNKLAGVAKEMQTLYSFATAETMGGMQENKKAALAKEISKAGESSKKGKKAVSLKKAPWDKKEDMDPGMDLCPDCGGVHEGSCGMSEGTWALPDTPKKKTELKKLLKKPLKAKDAAAKLNKLVGDDDLHDEIYDYARKNPNDDVRPMVKMFLQDMGINEDANIQLDELTAEEKKLINQMYDKKGNLTALGKKVMAAGSKNLKAGYIKAGYNEEVELDEAPARRNGKKGAPKMTGDSVAIQRAKDAEHNKAMGRTKTGRKKPVRTMSSTKKSLASLRGEEVELDEAGMTSAQKDKFDKLYKELDGGKEHKAIRVKIKNRIKADDAFHAMVKKMAMESVDEVKETVLPTHIQEMKDLNVKAGMITLGDGSNVKVSKDDLAALTKMTKGLSNNNRKSMLKSALENKKTFADMIAFAKEV